MNFLNKGEYEGELKKLLDFLFHNDKDYDAFSENNLRRQLEIFGEDISDRGYITWEDVVKYFDKLKPGFDTLLFEICKLMDKEKQGAKGPFIYQVSLVIINYTLWHLCVPHLAQASYLPKNETLKNVFFIFVTLR